MKLSELARQIGAEAYAANPTELSREISGVGTIDKAGPQQITFLTNPRFRKQLSQTRAAAVILSENDPTLPVPQLIHKSPYAAMAKAAALFFKHEHAAAGQSELAFIHPEAKVHPSATIYPFAYLDRGAEIGEECVIYPQCYIGIDAKVGARSILFPGVTLMQRCEIGQDNLIQPGAVIGGDGFGFAPTPAGLEKIPQVGGVKLGDDIEVGSNSTIDRGAFDDTSLARGCKLDSHVHVGHGCQIGEYSMLCGMTGLAGSVKTGKRFISAGHGGVAPGVELPDNVTIGAMAGMTSSKTEAGEYLGMPARRSAEWRRETVATSKLPELLKTIRALNARIEALEASAKAGLTSQG